jgi:hypothetical protein
MLPEGSRLVIHRFASERRWELHLHAPWTFSTLDQAKFGSIRFQYGLPLPKMA